MKTRLMFVLFTILLLPLAGCVVLNLPPTQPQFAPQAFAAQLAQQDAQTLDSTLAQATNAWQQADTAASRARLGLVRGQWGYAGYAPEQAADNLLAALQATDAEWNENESNFLQFQAAQLRYIAARESRLQSSTARGDQLQTQLRSAEEKLRAIGNIERDLERQP